MDCSHGHADAEPTDAVPLIEPTRPAYLQAAVEGVGIHALAIISERNRRNVIALIFVRAELDVDVSRFRFDCVVNDFTIGADGVKV